jgi:hypothetical protein
MSGRILPDRHGYSGYFCEGIPTTHVDCIDCVDNKYQQIPIQLASVCATTAWIDYSGGLPITWPHPCQDKYTQGFLEVEYPDVPPVSVRGIGIKAGWAGSGTGGGYNGCYSWQWLDPSSLPPESKGYEDPGFNADHRWFYVWYDEDTTTLHYSDDNPAAQGNIKEAWTVPVTDVDEVRYGPFELNNGFIAFEYCGECPPEDYKGPFELYLTRESSETEFNNVTIYPGKIIKSDGTVIEVPAKYIGVTIASVYVYLIVDEDTDPSTWVIATATDYPVKADSTDTQYYLVAGQAVLGGTDCASGIVKFRQFVFGDYKHSGTGTGGGYDGPWKVTLTPETTNSIDVLTSSWGNWVDIGLETGPVPSLPSTSLTIPATGWVWLSVTYDRGTSKYVLALGTNTSFPTQTNAIYYHRLAWVKVETVEGLPTITQILQYHHGGIYLPGRIF